RSSACRARSALDPEGVGARDDGRQGPDGAAAPRGGLVGPAARPQRLRRRAGRDRRGVAAQRFATTRYSRRVAQRVPAVGAGPARLAIRDRFLSAFDRRTALTAGAVWAVWLGAVLAVVILGVEAGAIADPHHNWQHFGGPLWPLFSWDFGW